MIPELIKIFNCVAVKPGQKLFKPEMVNGIAMRCGYLVHPDACTSDVLKFLEPLVRNYNTTFYKSWRDVASLEEAEMRVLQLVHYLSTYSTDYQGKTFTMNDFPEEMRFTEFKILMPCSEESLFERIAVMLKSGIAIDAYTLELIVKQAIKFEKEYGWKIEPHEILNKEARAFFYMESRQLPYEPFELMRILMLLARDNALIINDTHTIQGINKNISKIINVFLLFDEKHIFALSSVFYRYKRIFLTIKSAAKMQVQYGWEQTMTKVNRLRRLAVKYHKPLKGGALQQILSQNNDPEIVIEAIRNEESPYVLIRILNYLRSICRPSLSRTFVIRNGRIWVGENKSDKILSSADKAELFEAEVIRRLKSLLGGKARKTDGKAKTVRFPMNLELAAPVSAKQFVGSIPYGSRFNLQTNNYIGVYWRNVWGTRDFDLWMVGLDGERIGWADNHKSDNILFSGDMTDADPEATEIMFCRGEWPDCTIRVVRFNGVKGSKFRVFFGADDLKTLPLNYMVNPDSLMLEEDLISDSRETTIGVIHNNKVYFANLQTGDQQLPVMGDGKTISYEQAFAEHFSSMITLRELLLSLGYEPFNEGNGEPDIDLAGSLSKDSLIELMTS